MPRKHSTTEKSLDLGPLMDRVRFIASHDPVLKTANAVIRAAVASYCEAWEAKTGQAPPAAEAGP